MDPREMVDVANKALEKTPVEDVSPIFRPGWFRSRKFIASVVLTAGCFAVAGFTGTLNASTAPLCAAPLMGWLGIEGAVDFARAWKK